MNTLPDTIMIRILTCYLCTSPKLPQSVAMPIANPHFFVYPPERGEIGQSLPRLAHFHLKTSLDRWQLIKWCFTSSLHSDSRTKPLKPHDEPKFFPSLLFKKQSWDIMNVSLVNDFFLSSSLYIRYDFDFRDKGEAYCNSWVVSGYASEVKNGFVTFSFNWKTRVTLIKWLNGIQTSSSLLFFLKIVRSRVSCEHGEAARRETRVSRLCRSTLSELGEDKTRYFWCDTRGSMVTSII